MCDVRCAAGWKNQKYVRCALQVAIPKWCIYLCVLQKRLSDMSVLKTPTHSSANCTYVGVLQWFWTGAVFETARWNPVKFWKASPSQFAMIKDMIKSTHMVQKFWDRHVFWCMQVASTMLSKFTQGPSLCSNMFLLQDQPCAKIVQPSEGIFQHNHMFQRLGCWGTGMALSASLMITFVDTCLHTSQPASFSLPAAKTQIIPFFFINATSRFVEPDMTLKKQQNIDVKLA